MACSTRSVQGRVSPVWAKRRDWLAMMEKGTGVYETEAASPIDPHSEGAYTVIHVFEIYSMAPT